jgi:hypothetical protein
MTLQKLSNHLALLIPNSMDTSDKQQRDLEFLQEMVPDRWEELYANRESLFNLSNPDFCGKVNCSIGSTTGQLLTRGVENSQEAIEVLA